MNFHSQIHLLKVFLRFSLRIRAGVVSAAVKNLPLGSRSFSHFCAKAMLAARPVWFCLRTCCRCRTWKPVGPPTSQGMLAPGCCKPGWDAGAPTWAWPVGNTLDQDCGELHVTEHQEAGSEPCKFKLPQDWKEEEEEWGILPIPHFKITGNKHKFPSCTGMGSSPQRFSSPPDR